MAEPVIVKSKLSLSRMGSDNPNFGKHHPDRASKIKAKYGDDIFAKWATKTSNAGLYERTPSIRAKMSNSAKGNHKWLGKHHTEASKE